jgi:hypothetical protein
MPTVTPFTLPVILQASGEHPWHEMHAASIMGNENRAQIQRKAGDPKYRNTRFEITYSGIMRHFKLLKVCPNVLKTRLKRAQNRGLESRKPNETSHFAHDHQPKKRQ